MDEGPLGAAATARLLERHDLRPRKALGQHFLIDPNTTRRIVDAAGVGPGDRVVEVGAGVGTLTSALAATGASVVAYEVDERLRPLLAETLDGFDVDVRYTDVVRSGLDLEGGPWTMVANLPYNVGTPLVLDLLTGFPPVTRFVVMLQREAVERLAAGPGSKVYGLPSVVAALHGTVSVAFRVPATVFLPRPDVESAVAVIDRIDAHPLAAKAIATYRCRVMVIDERNLVRFLSMSVETTVESKIVLAITFPSASCSDYSASCLYAAIAEACGLPIVGNEPTCCRWGPVPWPEQHCRPTRPIPPTNLDSTGCLPTVWMPSRIVTLWPSICLCWR